MSLYEQISRSLLQAHCACGSESELVGSLFPQGVRPTPEAMRQAVAGGVNVWWGWMLLPRDRQVAYALRCLERVQATINPPRRLAACLEAASVYRQTQSQGAEDQLLQTWGAAWIEVRDADTDPLVQLEFLSEEYLR